MNNTNQSISSSAANDETMQRLRKKLYKLADAAAGLASSYYYNHQEIEGDITSTLQALAAEIERAEVGARLDEVNLMPPIFGPYKRERLRVLRSKTGGDDANRSDT
jgi:hypothetical protein